MRFEELDEFKKDCKQLLKKYRSLEADLDVVRKVLEVHPGERPPFSFRMTDINSPAYVIKLKKIACQVLKSGGANSGLRLIYAWFEREERIVFIELYHDNEKQKENRQRIVRNFK